MLATSTRPKAALPLLFIRHGETDWNAEGRLQGQRDIPLNDKGRAQARRNGIAIAGEVEEIAKYDFVASPLGRARETMEIIRASLGLDPDVYRLDERLMEISYGEWEGFTGDELKDRSPGLIAEREADKWAFLPPKGESYQRLAERVDLWANTLERPTLTVAHGGVGRVLRIRLLGLEPHEVMSGPFRQDRAFHWLDGGEALI